MCVVYCSSEFNKSKTFRLQFRGIAFSISSRRRFGTSKVVFHVFGFGFRKGLKFKMKQNSDGIRTQLPRKLSMNAVIVEIGLGKY